MANLFHFCCQYFCIVTMSTVGYGDFSPTTPATRFFTIMMMFVGIGVVFPVTAAAVGRISSPVTAKGRALLEKMVRTVQHQKRFSNPA